MWRSAEIGQWMIFWSWNVVLFWKCFICDRQGSVEIWEQKVHWNDWLRVWLNSSLYMSRRKVYNITLSLNHYEIERLGDNMSSIFQTGLTGLCGRVKTKPKSA